MEQLVSLTRLIHNKRQDQKQTRDMLTCASTKNVMLLQIKNKFEGLRLCRCPNMCAGCRRVSLQAPPHSTSSVTRHLHLKIGVRNNGLGSSPSAILQVMFLAKHSGAHLPVAPGPSGERTGTGLPTSGPKQTQAGLGGRGLRSHAFSPRNTWFALNFYRGDIK